MPRFKNSESLPMFVDSTGNEIKDRRKRENDRYRILTPAELMFNEKHEFVRIINLSYGGCQYLGTTKIPARSRINMTFFNRNDEGHYIGCSPIHGQVLNIIKRENYLSVNVDFKGIVYKEHGIEELIMRHLEDERRREEERLEENR